jgi:hypothetical protein
LQRVVLKADEALELVKRLVDRHVAAARRVRECAPDAYGVERREQSPEEVRAG